jgi:hypothetical protein
MDARRSVLVFTPPFGKQVVWVTCPTASNVICTTRGGVSPLPLAVSRRRITKTQSGMYVNTEKNVRTELSLHSYVVSCGGSLYVSPNILGIYSTSAGAVSSLAAEYCHGSRRYLYMARGSLFIQNLITVLKRARMLRAGMLVRGFPTSVPKRLYSSWTLLLELLSVQSGSMMTAQNTQTRESPPDSPGFRQGSSTLATLAPAGGRTTDSRSGKHLVGSSFHAPFYTPFPQSPRSACPSPPSLPAPPLGVYALIGGSSSPSSSPIVMGTYAAMAFSCVWVLSKQSRRNAQKVPHHSWYSPSRSLRCVHIHWNCVKCFVVVFSTKRM